MKNNKQNVTKEVLKSLQLNSIQHKVLVSYSLYGMFNFFNKMLPKIKFTRNWFIIVAR